ncbi:MAG: hypothetical protein K2X87_18025 [Gemmataceae bacterium]|nr:hypothetical protein [Gemmataceae bacterium]
MNARTARIWAEGGGSQYYEFKNKDLALVPEVDGDGDHRYLAEDIDVFYFTVH